MDNEQVTAQSLGLDEKEFYLRLRKNQWKDYRENEKRFAEYIASQKAKHRKEYLQVRASVLKGIQAGHFVTETVYRMYVRSSAEFMASLNSFYDIKEAIVTECFKECGIDIDFCGIHDFGISIPHKDAQAEHMWEVTLGKRVSVIE